MKAILLLSQLNTAVYGENYQVNYSTSIRTKLKRIQEICQFNS